MFYLENIELDVWKYIYDSIVRRMNTDDEQFANFRDFDLRVRNADF